jgi:phosphatidylinositol glycan class N
MAALLIWKILIPFLLVAVVYGIINRKLKVSESGAMFTVVAVSELMTINFFFLVQVNIILLSNLA